MSRINSVALAFPRFCGADSVIGGSFTGLIGPAASYECGEVAGNFDVKRRVVLFHSGGQSPPPSNLFLEKGKKEVQPWSWLSGQPIILKSCMHLG